MKTDRTWPPKALEMYFHHLLALNEELAMKMAGDWEDPDGREDFIETLRQAVKDLEHYHSKAKEEASR